MAKKKKARKKEAGAKAGKVKSRRVEIGMELHKLVESERRDFAESDNDILRRLVGLDDGAKTHSGDRSPATPRRAKSGGATDGGWSKINRHGRAVFLPDGTPLRAAYAGHTIEGRILDGMWVIGDKGYNSPSAALIDNVRTRTGGKVNLNGWRHWEVLLPDEATWVRLADL